MNYQIAIAVENALIEAITEATPMTVIGFIDGMIHVRLNGVWEVK